MVNLSASGSGIHGSTLLQVVNISNVTPGYLRFEFINLNSGSSGSIDRVLVNQVEDTVVAVD